MQPVRYGLLHRLVQKLASTAAGSWLLARVLPGVDRLGLKLSRGQITLTSILAGVPVMWVTTTGARSGKPRTRPLLPIPDPEHPGRYALIASNFGQRRFPAWYYNLKKHPQATGVLNAQTMTLRAHEAAGEEYERFWRYATDTYFGYALYARRAGRRVPIIVLERVTI
jgi:deazaflavin-dependent oxidoreductase (nitroreductase family)